MTEPLSPLGSTFSPKQRGRAEGEEERGRWHRNRKRSWSGRRAGGKAKTKKRGIDGRERASWEQETCRRISLGSGAGLFNEQAHSTPPSSVAPAGWRPPGSGYPVGALACSISAEGEFGGELRLRIYFLSQPVEHIDTCFHRLKKKRRRQETFTEVHTHILREERFPTCAFCLPPIHVGGITDTT